MIQTTYRLLIDDDTDPRFTQQIEALTGAKEVYGFDTPINLTTILDGCGLETALTAFFRATVDVSALAQVIAINWVSAHLYAYQAALPNDTRPFDLMYYLTLFLQTDGTVPPRVDYCGNDLGGVGLIPANQLEDLENNIQATIDALDLSRAQTVYTMLILNNGPLTDVQAASALGGNVISISRVAVVDNAKQVPLSMPGYVEQPITAAITANPDAFLTQPITYTPDSPFYYIIKYQNQSTDTQLVNFTNRAGQEIGQAAIYASQQVREGSGDLLTLIYNQIRVGVSDYNTGQRILLKPQLARYNQWTTGMPSVGSGIPEWDTDGQAVQDVGLNIRAQLLRDPAFLATFDTDGSGGLSAAERIVCEKSIQARMLLARNAAAQTLYDAVNAKFQALAGVTDTLSAIFRTYLV